MSHIGYFNAHALHDKKFAQAVCLLETSLMFCLLVSTSISITNYVFPIHLFIFLLLVLSTTANPGHVTVHMVVFIFLSNHTFVLLFSLPYPLHTRLLSHSLAFVLPLFIILHTQYKMILSKEVYII